MSYEIASVQPGFVVMRMTTVSACLSACGLMVLPAGINVVANEA